MSVNSQDQGKIVMNLGHTSVTSHFTSIVSVCINSQDQGKIVMNLGHTSVTSHFTSIVSM